MSTAPETLDVDEATGGVNAEFLYPIYDRLIHVTPAGEYVPGLAVSWDFPDGTGAVVELKLRDGVVFHDGTPFDAAAAAATFEYLKGAEVGLIAQHVSEIESVEVVDAMTIRINLTGPNFSIVANLSGPLGMMISPTALEAGLNLDVNEAGAGPFVLQDWRPGDRAIYTRFDDYWDPDQVRLAGLELILQGDSQTRLNSVRAGDVDFALLEDQQIETARDAGLQVDVYPNHGVYNIFKNTIGFPELEIDLVRQAIHHATDREALALALTFGTGEGSLQIFPPGYPSGYNPDFPADFYPYDPEKAKELLVEAGFPNGLSWKYIVLNRPADVTVAEALQAMWAEANLNVELVVVDPAAGFSSYLEDEGGMIAGRMFNVADPLTNLSILFSEGGFVNRGDFTTPRMNELLAELASTPFGPERDELARQASAEAVETAVSFGLFTLARTFAQQGCVVDFVAHSTQAPEYKGVGKLADC